MLEALVCIWMEPFHVVLGFKTSPQLLQLFRGMQFFCEAPYLISGLQNFTSHDKIFFGWGELLPKVTAAKLLLGLNVQSNLSEYIFRCLVCQSE